MEPCQYVPRSEEKEEDSRSGLLQPPRNIKQCVLWIAQAAPLSRLIILMQKKTVWRAFICLRPLVSYASPRKMTKNKKNRGKRYMYEGNAANAAPENRRTRPCITLNEDVI